MKKINLLIIIVALLVIISGCKSMPTTNIQDNQDNTQNTENTEPILDQFYSGRGTLQIINQQDNYITIDHEAIPGFMESMIMSFEPESWSILEGSKEGDRVEFKIKSDKLKSKILIYEIKKLVIQQPPTPPITTGLTVKEFTIEGDDSNMYPPTITVNKNDKVKITFKARSQGVYYGGLDFKSAYFDTGTIKPGEQKTVEFTADKTFTFTSYWPATGVKKVDGEVIVQ